MTEKESLLWCSMPGLSHECHNYIGHNYAGHNYIPKRNPCSGAVCWGYLTSAITISAIIMQAIAYILKRNPCSGAVCWGYLASAITISAIIIQAITIYQKGILALAQYAGVISRVLSCVYLSLSCSRLVEVDHRITGHSCTGHSWIDHDFMGHDYVGSNLTGHDNRYAGHNYIDSGSIGRNYITI